MLEGFIPQNLDLITKVLPQYLDSTTSKAVLGGTALLGIRILFPLVIRILSHLAILPSRILGGLFNSNPLYHRRPVYYSSGSRWSIGILCFIAGIFVASYISRSTTRLPASVTSVSKPEVRTVVTKKEGHQQFEVVSTGTIPPNK